MRISDWSSDVCSSDLWKIAMRPGKPLMFGDLAGTPVLGLPGNPVSAVVCSLLFARPALNALLGLDVPAHQIGSASCRERVCQYVSISVVAVSLKKQAR